MCTLIFVKGAIDLSCWNLLHISGAVLMIDDLFAEQSLRTLYIRLVAQFPKTCYEIQKHSLCYFSAALIIYIF